MKLSLIAEATLDATVAYDPNVTVDMYSSPEQDSQSTFHNVVTHLNPNDLLERGKNPQSIIYTGNLYVDDDTSGRAHASFYLKGNNRSLQRELGRHLNADPRVDPEEWKEEWRSLYSRFLFGRIAWVEGNQVLSFWGHGSGSGYSDIQSPAKLIIPAVHKLHSAGYIRDNTTVVLGDGSVNSVADLLGGRISTPNQNAGLDNETAKQLHLSTGHLKKSMMRQLGVGGGGSDKPNQWDVELRKLSGGLAPGQNRWRMSSEAQLWHYE